MNSNQIITQIGKYKIQWCRYFVFKELEQDEKDKIRLSISVEGFKEGELSSPRGWWELIE